MKADIKTAVEFINKNFEKLEFYPNTYNYIVFKKVDDGDYSLEKSRFGVDNDFGFQLCSISNRRDETTLFFKLSDIINYDPALGATIEDKINIAKNAMESRIANSNFKIVKSYVELSTYDLDCMYNERLILVSTYTNKNNEYCYIFKKSGNDK